MKKRKQVVVGVGVVVLVFLASLVYVMLVLGVPAYRWYLYQQALPSSHRDILENTFINGDFESDDLSAWDIYRDVYDSYKYVNETGRFVYDENYYSFGEDNTTYFILWNEEAGVKLSVAQTISLKGLDLSDCRLSYRYRYSGQLGVGDFVYVKVIFLDKKNGGLGAYDVASGLSENVEDYPGSKFSKTGISLTSLQQGEWEKKELSVGNILNVLSVDPTQAAKLRLSFGIYNQNGNQLNLSIDDAELSCT